MPDPFISIITTVKNGERFLQETLESVYEQTYHRYEHIIIDDGSVDNTVNIIEYFCDKRQENVIRLIKTKGIGRGKALNLGVEHARGEWIAIIDADDLWHPQKLALQVKIVEEKKVDVLGTYCLLGKKNPSFSFQNNLDTPSCVDIKKKKLCISNPLSHSSVIIRKELCKYDESRQSQFDYALWLKLYSQRYILANITEPLTFHRIYEGQSFEAKMGKAYKIRSFKLKARYAFKNRCVTCLTIIFVKLVLDLVLTRNLRNYIFAPFR